MMESEESTGRGCAYQVHRRLLLPSARVAPTPPPAAAAAAAAGSGDPKACLFQHIIEEVLLDIVREAGNMRSWAAAKVRSEHGRVERGGHEDELEVRAPRQDVAQDDEEEVLVHAALVNLVDHDVRDALEGRVAHELPQEHAGGTEEKTRRC